MAPNSLRAIAVEAKKLLVEGREQILRSHDEGVRAFADSSSWNEFCSEVRDIVVGKKEA